MAKRIYSTFAMLSILFILTIVSVQAQTADRLEINIPFDFQVGGKTLPAGEYNVQQRSQTILLIQSVDGKSSALAQAMTTVEANQLQKSAPVRLVFNQYGEQYFLSQVWMTAGGNGRELPVSDTERRASREQNLAAGGKKIQKVAVAARAR